MITEIYGSHPERAMKFVLMLFLVFVLANAQLAVSLHNLRIADTNNCAFVQTHPSNGRRIKYFAV